MADPYPRTRGSPANQLTAFEPPGVNAVARRTNVAPISGIASARSQVDPFTGWLGPVVLPGVASNSYYPIQATAAGTAPGPVQDATLVLGAQPQQSQVHQSQISYDRLGFPVIASQLTPSDLHGRSQLPSGPQGSSSLEQTQYLPSRAQAAITQSQYSLSPGYINPDNQELLSARYSPSQGGVSLPYDPIHDAFNRMLAEINRPGPATGTQGYNNVGPGGPSSASQALPSALTPVAVTDQMPLPRTPSRAAGPPPCRSIIVENVPRDMEHAAIIGSVPQGQYPSVEGVSIRQVHTLGRFCVLFADLRDAISAYTKIGNAHPEWRVRYATIREVVRGGLSGRSVDISSQEDGQLVIRTSIDVSQAGRGFSEQTDEHVASIVATFGDVIYCNRVSEDGASVREYRVEYFNVHHASHAFSCLNGLLLDCLRFDVSYRTPSRVRTPHFGSPTSPVTPYGPSPTGLIGSEPTSPNLDVGVTPEHTIDLTRIRSGDDLRTTIMIRNIPNKVTSDQLKFILDETSFGKYDFVYLRMDFVHHCNVGYAFVNFADPIDIVDLVVTRQGTTWPDCISEKRAEISYATQQGKDNLIHKFRNSNVMTRPHDERPRLFHTNGPYIGSEAPFPGPNDANKLRRSVASTHQQGLFAPRNRSGSGASPRDCNGNVTSPRVLRSRARTMSISQTAQAARTSPLVIRHASRRSLHSPPEDFSSPRKMGRDRRFSNGRK